MNFERHWKFTDHALRLSIGNGIIKASVFYTSLIPRGDKSVYEASINNVSIGRFEKEDLAKKAVEENITIRIIKALNQVGYGAN